MTIHKSKSSGFTQVLCKRSMNLSIAHILSLYFNALACLIALICQV
jgi:hypothetical protein